ncbi:MAG TPA: hypothetical protein VGM50_09550 [Gemmatimonadaceae bacterium]|jgi:hypothetical protein
MEAQTTYAHDLVISAVSYDSRLLQDIIAQIGNRVRYTPACVGDTAAADVPALLSDDVSRIVLILSQRLWGHSNATSAEAAILSERARRHPESVIVVSLDDDPRPEWMSELQRCDLATAGVEGVASFALDAIVARGGAIRTPAPTAAPDAAAQEGGNRWPMAPIPYLGQPRAHGALRKELDALYIELKPRIAAVKALESDRIMELHQLPHRVVARLDDVGVSFSWVPGRSGSVVDGRLLVIEWSGLTGGKGVAALRTAQPARERTYSAEATDTANWCWRDDAPNGRASSTANLVGEWIDGAMMGAHALAAPNVG